MSPRARHDARTRALLDKNREQRVEIEKLEAKNVEANQFVARLAMRCEKLELLARRLRNDLVDERALLQSALHEQALLAGVEPKLYRSRWLGKHRMDGESVKAVKA